MTTPTKKLRKINHILKVYNDAFMDFPKILDIRAEEVDVDSESDNDILTTIMIYYEEDGRVFHRGFYVMSDCHREEHQQKADDLKEEIITDRNIRSNVPTLGEWFKMQTWEGSLRYKKEEVF